MLFVVPLPLISISPHLYMDSSIPDSAPNEKYLNATNFIVEKFQNKIKDIDKEINRIKNSYTKDFKFLGEDYENNGVITDFGMENCGFLWPSAVKGTLKDLTS